jgi:hypothetical protein
MKMEGIPFGTTDWESIPRTEHKVYRIQFLRQVEVGIHAASPRRMRRCAAGVR